MRDDMRIKDEDEPGMDQDWEGNINGGAKEGNAHVLYSA
jgi:hypothetical protein